MINVLLSIDQAAATSGFAVFNDNAELIDKGHWTTNSKDTMPERLDSIIQNIEQLCIKYPIDKVAFEDIQMQNGNVTTYKKLAEVYSIVEYWCEFAAKRYVVMQPTHWRSIISSSCGVRFGRKREEQKQAAIDFVKEHFNVDVTTDEADAVLIGYAAILNNEFGEVAWS